MITRSDLFEFFEYEERGMLRKVKNFRNPYPWRKAGKDGRYLITSFRGSNIYLHRAIWMFFNEGCPEMVDHINGNTFDCRIENLRACSNAQNQYNSKRKSNNISGFKGVVFHPRCPIKPWQAKITVKGQIVSLGYYSTPEAAYAAYVQGANKFAGEFARYA